MRLASTPRKARSNPLPRAYVLRSIRPASYPAPAVAGKYGKEVDEVIWALACELVDRDTGTVPAAEIRRRLAKGEAGLEHEVDMPERTFFDHLRRLTERRGEPRSHVKPGTEIDAAQAIRRRGIEMASRQMSDLEEKERAGTVTSADIDKLRKIAQTCDEVIRREEQRKSSRTGRTGAATDAAQGTPRRSLLDRLADEERKGAQSEDRAPSPTS